jgi:transposase
VLVAKFLDHAPLYRHEQIFGRAGLALPRSTLAQWVGACGVGLQPLADAMRAALLTRAVLHADETPGPMLKPGLGRTHRAYLWSYSSSENDELQVAVYDFADSRRGQHAREFLGNWSGKLKFTTAGIPFMVDAYACSTASSVLTVASCMLRSNLAL